MAFYNSINDTNNFVISCSQNPKQDFGVFAKGYSQAASSLATQLLEKSHFADYEAYPVVFLYRHAFELYLKGFYYKAILIFYFKNIEKIDFHFVNKHCLEPLATTFKEIIEICFPTDQEFLRLADRIRNYAIEFEEIDKRSFSYRYPIDTSGKPSTKSNQLVNLSAFKSSMDDLIKKLEIIDFGFAIEASREQQLFEVIEETENKLKPDNFETG